MQLTISIDPARLAALNAELAEFPGEVDKVAAKAINAAAQAGKTDIIRSYLARTTLDQKTIKTRVKMSGGKATPSRLLTTIGIKTTPISLMRYSHRDEKRGGGGVTVQVFRGRLINLPGAFIGISPRGKTHIIERNGPFARALWVHYLPNKGRLRQKVKTSPGRDLVSLVEARPEIIESPLQTISDTLNTETAKGIDQVLNRGAAKTSRSSVAGLVHRAAIAIYSQP